MQMAVNMQMSACAAANYVLQELAKNLIKRIHTKQAAHKVKMTQHPSQAWSEIR